MIDASTGAKRATIKLGGEAGNTHYDPVSHCVLVAVQTKNQLAAIDPIGERIVQRYDLPGSDHPHGFRIDDEDRLAFVSSEGNARLQVVAPHAHTVSVDPRTHRVYLPLENAGGRPVLRIYEAAR